MSGFVIGDLVESIGVGRLAAFQGEIVHIERTKKCGRPLYFHVRDSEGRLWHRDHSEIWLVTSAETRGAG